MPNGAGGGAVWEGDVGDFDLREVAPSLADLVDAVATAMERGSRGPTRIGGFRDPGLGRAGLGSIEGRTLAGSANRQRPVARWPPRWLEIQGLDPARRASARRQHHHRRAPRARRRVDGHGDDQRDDQGAVRVRRRQRRPAGRRHRRGCSSSSRRTPTRSGSSRTARPSSSTCVRSTTAWTSGRRSILRRSRRSRPPSDETRSRSGDI